MKLPIQSPNNKNTKIDVNECDTLCNIFVNNNITIPNGHCIICFDSWNKQIQLDLTKKPSDYNMSEETTLYIVPSPLYKKGQYISLYGSKDEKYHIYEEPSWNFNKKQWYYQYDYGLGNTSEGAFYC